MIRTAIPFNASLPSVLITGAQRGIGLSLAKVFHAHHANSEYNVIGTSIEVNVPDSIAELSKVSTAIIPLDVTNEADITQLPSLVKTVTPSLNVLINNAGIMQLAKLGSLTQKLLLDHFTINSVAPILITQALVPMLRDAGGKVAQITSQLGSIGDNTSGDHYAYRCSKAALNMGTMSLMRDVKEVTFLLLHPGTVRTQLTGHQGNVDADDVAKLFFDIIKKSTVADSGKYLNRDGNVLPW